MKKLHLFAIIMAFTFSFTLSYADSWQFETIDSTGAVGKFTNIVFDSTGKQHVAYYSDSAEDVKYARYDGSNWQIEIVDSAGNVGISTHLALDSNDRPHIVYYNKTGLFTGNLKYAHWDGSSWQIEIVDSSVPDVGPDSRIAIDSNDRPHISYCDNTNVNLKYARWDGSTWQIETVEDSADYDGVYNDIVLDSNDYPHICHRNNSTGELKYAEWDGSTWHYEVIDTDGSVGAFTSICLDSNGYEHISYYDWPDNLKYARWDGSTWQKEVVGPGGRHTSMVLDSNDHPQIAHYVLDTSALEFTHWDGSSWITTTVDNTGDVGSYCCLALDSDEKPHITYYDLDSGDMDYAWYGTGVGISLSSFSATTSNDAVKLEWNAVSDCQTIAGFNIYRTNAGETNKKNAIKLNDSLITGSNPYTYQDRNITPSGIYDYTLEAVLASDKTMMLGNTSGGGVLLPSDFAITSVHPNPAASTLTCRLAIAEAGALELSLYDLSGRLVQTQRISATAGNTETTLDVSTLASGVYTLRANSGGADAAMRVVVTR